MIVNNHAVLILTVKGELRMGLIDLFQKTRETSMEMKPQEDEAAKVVTCKGCGAELKAYAYGKNLYVCPHCGRYGRLLARTRIRQIADKDSFEELYANLAPADPIHFPGYAEKTAELAEKVGMPDAVKTGVCKIGGVETAIGVMDSHFMMASMGSVVGEKLTRLFEYATEKGLPVVLFTCSGGARMQEGMFSLLRDGKGVRGGAPSLGRWTAVYHRADRPDHGRCYRVVCHAGRYYPRGAAHDHRLCRPPCHRGHHRPDPPGRFSVLGVLAIARFL